MDNKAQTRRQGKRPTKLGATTLATLLKEYSWDEIMSSYQQFRYDGLLIRSAALSRLGLPPNKIWGYKKRAAKGEALYIEFFDRLEQADSELREEMVVPIVDSSTKDPSLRLKLAGKLWPDLKQSGGVSKADIKVMVSNQVGLRLEKIMEEFVEGLQMLSEEVDLTDDQVENVLNLMYGILERQ